MQKGMDRDRRMSFAVPDRQAIEAELQIAHGLEADLLHVNPRIVGIGMSLEAAHKNS